MLLAFGLQFNDKKKLMEKKRVINLPYRENQYQ